MPVFVQGSNAIEGNTLTLGETVVILQDAELDESTGPDATSRRRLQRWHALGASRRIRHFQSLPQIQR
jgi:hypothetical protein